MYSRLVSFLLATMVKHVPLVFRRADSKRRKTLLEQQTSPDELMRLAAGHVAQVAREMLPAPGSEALQGIWDEGTQRAIVLLVIPVATVAIPYTQVPNCGKWVTGCRLTRWQRGVG